MATTRARRGHGEGGIWFDAAHNRYEATIEAGTDPLTGKRLRFKVRAATKTEVLTKMRDARKQHEAQLRPGAGAITVGELLDRWLVSVVDGRVGSNNTRANYDQMVRLHLKPALGSIRLDQLTADHVDTFLASKAAAGLARTYIGRMRSTLADALRHAERRGLVVRNVAELSTMPRAKAPAERRSLTPDEARKLMAAAAGERLEALVTVGLAVGLRPGELCGLRWSDLDFVDDPPTLTVAGALKRVARLDGPGYDLEIGAVKRSTAGRRTVALPQAACDALRAHKARQAAERLEAGELWHDTGLIFASPVGEPLDPTHVRRVFDRIAKRAGLAGGFTYLLRHTAASLMLDAGAGLEEVADVLGDDPRTVLRHYRHKVRPVAAAGLAMQSVLQA
jgi:integrase